MKNKNHQDQSKMLSDKVFKRMNSTNLNSPFRKFGCEIVKYKPQYYKDGIYTKNEWISVSDIGSSFDGEVLTKEEYLRVEAAYVDTVKELLGISGVKFLTIVNPNTYYLRREKAFNKENKALYQIVSSLKEGQRIAVSKIDTVLKACLRELFWCAMVNEAKKVQVDVGYDYYLHFHSRLPEETISKIARSHGLYCNPR
ncbi:MAG: hypothetical protein J6P54_00940 [Bacteroidales bacterium]|nr:hypothetical protein [Bacteroidales bacterium]